MASARRWGKNSWRDEDFVDWYPRDGRPENLTGPSERARISSTLHLLPTRSMISRIGQATESTSSSAAPAGAWTMASPFPELQGY